MMKISSLGNSSIGARDCGGMAGRPGHEGPGYLSEAASPLALVQGGGDLRPQRARNPWRQLCALSNSKDGDSL